MAAHVVLTGAREAATDLDGVVAQAELVELAVAQLGQEADVEAARQGLELEGLGHDDHEDGRRTRVPGERATF